MMLRGNHYITHSGSLGKADNRFRIEIGYEKFMQ